MNGENDEFISDPEDRSENLPSIDAAYVGSEAHFWNGKQLAPFSVMRRSAAYSMGLRWDRWRDEDRREMDTSGIYNELPTDIIITMFLCSIPATGPAKESQGWTVARCLSDPGGGLEKAFEWAEKNALDYTPEGIPKATPIFLKIVREIDRSKFTVQPRKSGNTMAVAAASSGTPPNE